MRVIKTFFFVVLITLAGCQGITVEGSYSPPGLPLKITADSNGKITFEVQQEVKIPTFLGTFSVGVVLDPSTYFDKESTLTIRLDNQDHIYDLYGQDFSISFESGYYEEINLTKRGSDILLVLDRIDANATDTIFLQQPYMTNVDWVTLINDNFSTDSHGWSTGKYSDDLATTNKTIANGVFTWSVTAKDGFVAWDWPVEGQLNSPQHYIEADARQISGPSNAEYGIVFRIDKDGNYYIFRISYNLFSLYSFYNDQWIELIGWSESSIIITGGFNHLGVLLNGSFIQLYINGYPVGETTDKLINAGNSGLVVGLSSAGDEGVFEFDNFQIYSPVAVAGSTEPIPVSPTTDYQTAIPAKAILSADPPSGKAPLTVSFLANLRLPDGELACVKASNCTYEWSVNGKVFTTKTLSYTFKKAGAYDVTLRVCNAFWCDNAFMRIVVNAK